MVTVSERNVQKLLNPVGEVEYVDMGLAPRLGDLNGKVIGFLDNSKRNADALIARTEALLHERFKLGPVFRTRKLRASGRAQDMEELAKCDAVVAGIGL
ncbi:MAG: hypothetical protein HYX92_14970 [Chloroflexi bacterium]|nr:hypothetical protein [Chloroflexota bacterium]